MWPYQELCTLKVHTQIHGTEYRRDSKHSEQACITRPHKADQSGARRLREWPSRFHQSFLTRLSRGRKEIFAESLVIVFSKVLMTIYLLPPASGHPTVPTSLLLVASCGYCGTRRQDTVRLVKTAMLQRDYERHKGIINATRLVMGKKELR
ncbi:hypothetical protein BDV97DRAFT_203736 [Delphinella strobiligena]|nr:hypothetical protein BDV97DRAFT_203736 [Delphinella strobiligena]